MSFASYKAMQFGEKNENWKFFVVIFKPPCSGSELDLNADIFHKAGEPREASPGIGEALAGAKSHWKNVPVLCQLQVTIHSTR